MSEAPQPRGVTGIVLSLSTSHPMIGAQPSIGTPLPDSGSRTLTEKKPGGAGIVKVFCSIRMALILFDHIGRPLALPVLLSVASLWFAWLGWLWFGWLTVGRGKS